MTNNLDLVSVKHTGNTHCDAQTYEKMYQQSLENGDAFWAEQAKRIDWIKPFTQISDVSYDAANLYIRWFADGEMNVAQNCIDRHLEERANQTAIIWEGDEPDVQEHITYQQLHTHVCRFANALKANGVKKGDRVTIYMPMIPQAAYAMLACARIGAVHSVVFGGFSPDALAGRINDCQSTCLITADEGVRGGKAIALKANADKALEQCPDCRTCIVVQHTKADIAWVEGRDIWYHKAIADVADTCAPEPMNAEDPLFILYTSGSTGKPKGVLHTQAGYLVYAAMTHQYVFDYQDAEIYWCTADVGWITGHSYIIYGPLANGATTLMFEGVPNYPDASRFWQVVNKHKVSIFYTAPTALRALMREGDDLVKKIDRSSLRILGTVGEPINPEAWRWYYEVVGESRCAIVDTWWQTETGGIMIAPLPGAIDQKPGSATK
ncbi:MAG: acetate--CoA ligase, partial [Pseudomonadota bacterium]